MSERSPWWLAVVGASGVALGALITGAFNYLSHQNDLDAKMIELSVGILRSDPTAETAPLREWAIDVIDKRAKFSFNAAQRAALLKKQLPFKGGSFTWGPFSGSGSVDDGIIQQAPSPPSARTTPR
jgi:hypothetical protein